MYIDSYRVTLLHRARKHNSAYTSHAVLLESRVIVLHAEIMFLRPIGTQVQWFREDR